MKISIITLTFNSEIQIDRCLQSVQSQTYTNIEHVIQDGGSTDKTMEKISQAKTANMRVFSELDRGIYDALNKAIKNSTGELIMLLHSNDLFADEFVVENIAESYATTNWDWSYGDVSFFDPVSEIQKRVWVAGKPNMRKIFLGWMPPHPTLVLKRNVAERLRYDDSLKISADYKYFLDLYSLTKNYTYQERLMTKMSYGGISTSLKGKFISLYEDSHATADRAGVNRILTPLLKKVSKLHQYF